MITPNYPPPKGFEFDDAKRGRMLFCQSGEWTGWLFKRHPDGDWVSVRLATKEDLEVIAALIAQRS